MVTVTSERSRSALTACESRSLADDERRVREFCRDRDHWPTARAFAAAGLGPCRKRLRAAGRLDEIAADLGLELPGRGGRLRYTDEVIERALGELCAGKDLFPSLREFREAGLIGIYDRMRREGTLDFWAQRLGLERQSSRSEMTAVEARKVRRERSQRIDLEAALNSGVAWKPPLNRPTREPLTRALRDFLATWEGKRAPSRRDFRRAGLEEFYWQLRATADLRDWGAEFGYPSWGHSETLWTGPRIEQLLIPLVAGRRQFPGYHVFAASGPLGRPLYYRVQRFGGSHFWARWMGLLPPRPTDEDIDVALSTWFAERGSERWPTRAEFKAAGLSALHNRLRATGRLEHWRAHFHKIPSTAREEQWPQERIERVLRELGDKLGGRMPSRNEVRAFGGGLEAALARSGGRRRWQTKLGLRPNPVGRPRKEPDTQPSA